MSRTNNWQDHWLDLDCHGYPLREWCTNSTKEPGFAHCRVCNLRLKYLKIGVRALKDHGKSKKHLENCKAAVDISSATSSPSPTADGRLVNPPCSFDQKAVICMEREKLQEAALSSDATQFQGTQEHQAVGAAIGLVPYYQVSNTGCRNALVPVYPCFFCPEEFLTKHLLHDHQTSCIMKPPILQAVMPIDSESTPSTLENEFPPSISPRINESSNISSDWSLNPSKSEFIASLGVLPKKKAQKVSQRRRNTECENIDWEEEVSITPSTPSSTRTPKLLISHLSRDSHDNCRRRLSVITDGKVDRERECVQSGDTHKNADNEHVDEQEKKMTVCKSLYNLDVTSPLGQFVIKHFKGDPSLHILSDIESHCLTSSAPKNSSISRLRVRNVTYATTFRGYSAKYGINAHQYKFNKKDVREFMKTVNTGLNKRSRRLNRQMKTCKVLLTHVTKADLKYWIPSQNQLTVDLRPLSATEIAFWTMPKPTPSLDSLSVFPNGLTFTSPNVNSILGLKTRKSLTENNNLHISSLTLTNFVSEEMCAELVQNRKVLYRSLLSDCYSHNSVRFSKREDRRNKHPTSYSLLRQMLKQNPKEYDMKSKKIICNSSENNVPVEQSHLSGSQVRKDIKILAKSNKSIVTNKFSDSLILQLTPVDRHGLPSYDNIKSLSYKEWNMCRPAYINNDIQTEIQEKETKFLGGFSVKVRLATEGQEIVAFPDDQQLLNSFISPSENMERKSTSKKNGQTAFFNNGVYSQQTRLNRFSSPKRNLRSTPKGPFSTSRRVNKNNKSSCLNTNHDCQKWQVSSCFNKSKRRNMLVSKSSTRKCSTKEARLQYAKSHHYTSPGPCPSLEDQMRLARCTSRKQRSFTDSMALRQKFDAAGLLKRYPESSTSNSPVLSRQMKPTVPISNKTSKNSSNVSTSHISNSLLNQTFASEKQSHYPVLRKSKSKLSACTLAHPSHQEERRKFKNEKRKKFMLWLQNLRKGNIT